MTLRYTNLACFAILGSLVYFIGRRAGRSKLIPLAGVLLCVSAPNVLTIPRTQYYIMLHGCIFFFLSVIVLLVKTDGETEVPPNILVLAGVLQGLAFYGYFTYLFLAPATLIVALLSCRGTLLQKMQGGGIPYLWGILIGSLGYFIGYYDSIITNIFGEALLTKCLLAAGILCMALYLAAPVVFVWSGWRERYAIAGKAAKIHAVITAVGAAVLCIAGLGLLIVYRGKLALMTNLFAGNQTRNAGSIFGIFWKLMYQLISNESAQNLIFGEQAGGFYWFYPAIGIGVTLAVGLTALLCRKKERETKLLKYIGAGYLYLIAYYIFTLAIVRGMQPQHFVVTYFLLSLLLIMDGIYLVRHMPTKIGVAAGILLFAAGIYGNAVSDIKLTDMLEQTEGRGRFSAALDRFAEQAYADPDKANKIYVFPQWGFNANFIYLTDNSCQTVRDADIDYHDLQERLDEGYTLVIAAFDEDVAHEFEDRLDAAFWEWHEADSKEGVQVFVFANVHK